MTTMTANGPRSTLGSDFDRFLFASLGKDGNGMEISVLSGLARSDLDPWQEAARLAALPGNAAAARLAALIGALPGKTWTYPEALAAATPLIDLLPRSFRTAAGPHSALPGLPAGAVARSWWIYVAVMSLMLGSQLIIATRQTPPQTPAADHANVTTTTTAAAGEPSPTLPPPPATDSHP